MSRTAWVVLAVVVVLVVGFWLLTPSPEAPAPEQPIAETPPPAPPPPPPPPPPDAKDVTLTWVGGEDCVNTDPDKPDIFKDKPGNETKLKKVQWRVDPTQEDLYRWEITYAADKAEEDQIAKDLLGAIDPIECGKKKTRSGPAHDDGSSDEIAWPYRVTVYQCQEEGEPVHLCDSDPIIWIKDQ